jgi:N-acetylmuramoyl-L-alanine amidase
MTDIVRERRLLSQQGLVFIDRETWGARQRYISDRQVIEPAQGFFLHISVTIDHGDLPGEEFADMRTIERIGQERFGIGFPYNAAAADTGRLYEGQPLTRRGAHTVNNRGMPGYHEVGSTRSLNFHYRAIVLPQMVSDDVTDAQVHTCARWAAAQIRSGLAVRGAIWRGHRDVANKGCPGDAGYQRLPEIRKLTEYYVRNGLKPFEQEYEDMGSPLMLAHGTGRRIVIGGVVYPLHNATEYKAVVKAYTDKGIPVPSWPMGREQWDKMAQASPASNVALAELEADVEEIRADLADEEPTTE